MNKSVNLYVNSTKPYAQELSKNIEKFLIDYGYTIDSKNPFYVIGLGGDGTLLNLLRNKNYNIDFKYIGVNCGTLGFMQDFDVENVDKFVSNIPSYIEKKIKFISLEVVSGKLIKRFKALNEFNIQSGNDKTFRVKVDIQNVFLENYIGTGIIFSTPTGSTAHNLSSIGAIIHPNLEVIQMTPREAIVNSKIHCLPKSICIPKEMGITLRPLNKDSVKIFSDGVIMYDGMFDEIKIHYSDSYMIKLTDKNFTFVEKIREKLI